MNKIITMNQAIDHIKGDGTLLIGRFLGVGTLEPIIDALIESKKKILHSLEVIQLLQT